MGHKNMSEYILKQHVHKWCTVQLNDDSVLQCGKCPFEEQILAVAPHLSMHFKLKRQLIMESKRKVKYD